MEMLFEHLTFVHIIVVLLLYQHISEINSSGIGLSFFQ